MLCKLLSFWLLFFFVSFSQETKPENFERNFKSQNLSLSGQLEMKIINGNQFYLTNTINNLTLAVNENGTLIQETLQLEDGVVVEHQGLIFFYGTDSSWTFFELALGQRVFGSWKNQILNTATRKLGSNINNKYFKIISFSCPYWLE